MATTKEIDNLIKTIAETRNLSTTNAIAFTLGFMTQHIPSAEVEKAIEHMTRKAN